jgi:hypothetical protein
VEAEDQVTFGGEEEAEGGTYISAACHKDAIGQVILRGARLSVDGGVTEGRLSQSSIHKIREVKHDAG